MATVENDKLRPSADEFLSIIRQQQTGKLKIYLGPSPGVGKTYQMLIEGNRLKRRGIDVVIGYVHPHDRPKTRGRLGKRAPVQPYFAEHHCITLSEEDLYRVIR